MGPRRVDAPWTRADTTRCHRDSRNRLLPLTPAPVAPERPQRLLKHLPRLSEKRWARPHRTGIAALFKFLERPLRAVPLAETKSRSRSRLEDLDHDGIASFALHSEVAVVRNGGSG